MSNESSETNLVASPVSAADRDVPLVGWAVQEVRNDVVAVGVHPTFRFTQAIDIAVVGDSVVWEAIMQTGVLPLEDIFVGELRFWRPDNRSEVESASDPIVALDPPEDSVSGTAHTKSLAVAVEAVVGVYGVICGVGNNRHGGKVILAP